MTTDVKSLIIHLATDHAGFEHKEIAKEWLLEAGYEVIDHGASEFNPEDDFPDFIRLAAKAIVEDSEENKAIIFGGSGQGEAMMANRFPKVRAAVYYGGSPEIVTLSREHNDANVLSLGARFISPSEMKEVIKLWLDTEFTNVFKYQRRNDKLDVIE